MKLQTVLVDALVEHGQATVVARAVGRAHVREAALEGQCAIDPGGVPTSLSMWREVCFLTLTELESDRTLPPSKTMCEMTQDMSVLAAVETAKRIVRLSHRKDLEGTFARQINLGYVKVLNELSEPGDTPKEVPSFVSKEDARAAQTNIRSRDMTNDNFKFAAPGDDGFQAFMKAYREQKPWVNNQQQKEAVKDIRK